VIRSKYEEQQQLKENYRLTNEQLDMTQTQIEDLRNEVEVVDVLFYFHRSGGGRHTATTRTTTSQPSPCTTNIRAATLNPLNRLENRKEHPNTWDRIEVIIIN
jgi:hypothetical protein